MCEILLIAIFCAGMLSLVILAFFPDKTGLYGPSKEQIDALNCQIAHFEAQREQFRRDRDEYLARQK